MVPSSSLEEVRHHFKDIPVPVNVTYRVLAEAAEQSECFCWQKPYGQYKWYIGGGIVRI